MRWKICGLLAMHPGRCGMIDKEFWRGKKVFLTGHTGFKGSWLSLWLNNMGVNVTGYSLKPPTDPSLFEKTDVANLVNHNIGDIRDLEKLNKVMINANPDIVIHMAAQPLVRESYLDPVGTYHTNVMGTVNVLEAVRSCPKVRAVVNVTTDKCYENKEWVWGYRENEPMGGYDPYSNSKGCSELVTSSYRNSFFNTEKYGKDHQVIVASARAGNVIGGGDWAKDRLIPDIIRSIQRNEAVKIRNPHAIRPWQHVLEPLYGYLLLCEKLYSGDLKFSGAWNFGPTNEGVETVGNIADKIVKLWGSGTIEVGNEKGPHEANLLMLDTNKARNYLNWIPTLNIDETIDLIVEWYMGSDGRKKELTEKQILSFNEKINNQGGFYG